MLLLLLLRLVGRPAAALVAPDDYGADAAADDELAAR